ncbi:MAG: glycosyltransferase family 4 protein [Azospirillaceae bacterium]
MIRVCYPFIGDRLGGSAISAKTMIRALPRDRVEPVVVLSTADGILAPFLADLDVPVETLPLPPGVLARDRSALGNVAALAAYTRAALRFLRAHRIDVVHVQDREEFKSWWLAARLAGLPFVKHQRAPAVRGRYDRFVYRRCAAVVPVSDFIRSTLDGLGAPVCGTVYNPFAIRPREIDRAEARAAVLAELGLPETARLVVVMARLTERKRQVLAVEALARLPADPPVHLLLPGAGPDAEVWRPRIQARAAELGLADRVHLLGQRADALRLTAASDVLAAPAVDEAFGRNTSEAVLLGTPVVASDSGGNPELFTDGHNGLLFPPDDVEAFAGALGRVLFEPGLAEHLADTALAEVGDRLSPERHAEAILSIYRTVTQR